MCRILGEMTKASVQWPSFSVSHSLTDRVWTQTWQFAKVWTSNDEIVYNNRSLCWKTLLFYGSFSTIIPDRVTVHCGIDNATRCCQSRVLASGEWMSSWQCVTDNQTNRCDIQETNQTPRIREIEADDVIADAPIHWTHIVNCLDVCSLVKQSIDNFAKSLMGCEHQGCHSNLQHEHRGHDQYKCTMHMFWQSSAAEQW